MKWLWQLFFLGRVRRLKRIQYAAALIAQGEIEEAETILAAARPRRWVDDLAVYHFVTGKLRMEQGELGQAERHLHAALALGLDRPSVKLNLAVLRVRQCNLSAALALLEDVDLSDDPTIRQQSQVMREVIAETLTGAALPDLEQRAARFRKKHLKRVSPDDPGATLAALAQALTSAKLSAKDREDACLLFGAVLVEAAGGQWLLGLEPRDHQVLAAGVLHHPAQQIDQILAGERETLSLPAPPS